MREEGTDIMASYFAFTGVDNGGSAAGMSQTFGVAAAAHRVAAHLVSIAHAAAALPQRHRRTATTAPSVDRGTV